MQGTSLRSTVEDTAARQVSRYQGDNPRVREETNTRYCQRTTAEEIFRRMDSAQRRRRTVEEQQETYRRRGRDNLQSRRAWAALAREGYQRRVGRRTARNTVEGGSTEAVQISRPVLSVAPIPRVSEGQNTASITQPAIVHPPYAAYVMTSMWSDYLPGIEEPYPLYLYLTPQDVDAFFLGTLSGDAPVAIRRIQIPANTNAFPTPPAFLPQFEEIWG